MQLGLIGLPGAGVKTIFSAVTALTESSQAQSGGFGQSRLAVVRIPDPRLQLISEVFKPKKTTPSTVELVESPGLFGQVVEPRALARIRQTEALALVLRLFASSTVAHIKGSVDPARDLDLLLSEMLLADLAIVEARVKRLGASLQKRKDEEEQAELAVLERCNTQLESGRPLSELPLLDTEKKRIRGFGFLTAKPLILLLNIGDNQLGHEEELTAPFSQKGYRVRALCGDIEAELAQMDIEDRLEFMQELDIEELAAPIVMNAAYKTLDLVTFYTYSDEECRAWDLHKGSTALDAAAKVHTDLARGFIRAEVVSYEDFQQFGDLKEVKAHGRFRLEGRDYVVEDGDLILIRHSN